MPAAGCQKANLTASIAAIGAELARHETAHVALLQTALKRAGVNPVAPNVDISEHLSFLPYPME